MKGMNSEKRGGERRSEAGATALFFVSVLLPLLFLLFSIALDVSAYFRAQQQAQLALDEAAMQATRFLPFTSLAQGAATTFLERYGELLQGTVVEVESDRVLLSLRKDVPITFAQFFLPGVGIPLESYASARVVPSDIYLAMDSSRLVGPGNPQETELFLENFPTATFFEYDLPSAPDNPDQGPRYRTALCFNPLFSTVKRAAIEIHEYLAGFRFNAVGVGVFPAPDGLLDIRPFSLTSSLIESGAPEGFFPAGLVYDRITAEWCGAAASFERVSAEYYFPSRQSGIPQLVSIDAPGESIIDATSYSFNPNYAPAVSLIEALWSVPVQKTEPQSDVVLGQLLSRIGGASFSARGGAQNAAHRVGILLSADVPWAVVPDGTGGLVSRRFGSDAQVEAQMGQALGAFRTFAAQSQLSQVDLFYAVVTNAQSQAAVEGQRGALEGLFERSRSDPATGEVQENFNARLIVASSAEEMRRRIAAALVLSGKNVVLSK
jgi:hypothetical protein